MKESIANSYIFTIIIVFVAIISLIIVSSISYSKAFKVKNKLIDIIEKYDGYDDNARDEIEEYLGKAGYKINYTNKGCPNEGDEIDTDSNYRYCIYKYNKGRGIYYKVVSYMFFDLPLVEGLIEIPVSGETRLLLKYIN